MKGVAIGLLCLAMFIQGLHSQRLPVERSTPTPMADSRTYIILAPNTIRPGLPLGLSVSILDAPSDVTVTASVLMLRRSGTTTLATVSESFSSGRTGILTVRIPDNEIGDSYKLEITGTGGLTFNQTEELEYSPNSFSILVQTDKAIYKPGQTVRFRAMAIYPDLKAYMGAFDVKLKDPLDNVIQQWIGLENADYGVVSGESIMSDAPVLGDWTLTVTAKNQPYDHVITIDEYVLPKFEVIVTPPPYILSTDTSAFVTVEAKYTYGEPVRGSVVMEITVPSYNSYRDYFTINGKADRLVSKMDLLGIVGQRGMYQGLTYYVRANVTEALTGIQQTGVSSVTYEERLIDVDEVPGNPDVFKPGLIYTLLLSVTHVDGSPLTDVERQQRLKVVTYYTEVDSFDQIERRQPDVAIPEDGVVKIDVNLDPKINWARLEVSYYEDGVKKFQKTINPAKSESSNFLQIIPQGTNFQAGSTASFQVKTTEATPKLSYQVFSKGNIVLSESMSGQPSTLSTLSFDVTPAMAPQARLVVSYVRSADVHELIMDSVDMSVDGAFQNEVTIGFNKAEVEPGNSIKLEVTAEANSFVGILAIDTSVRLLKTGNDITQSQVVEALGEFDTSNNNDDYGFGCPFCRERRSAIWWPFPTPGKTTREVLDSAGILVFTDALVYGVEDNSHYFFRYEDAAFAGFPVMADADMDQNAAMPGPLRVRSKFPETWLWSEHVAGFF